jgi:flagellar biosynthesis protein FliQ
LLSQILCQVILWLSSNWLRGMSVVTIVIVLVICILILVACIVEITVATIIALIIILVVGVVLSCWWLTACIKSSFEKIRNIIVRCCGWL